MPQMAPLWWLFLMMLFLFSYFIFMTFIYFNKLSKMNLSTYFSFKNMNWLW